MQGPLAASVVVWPWDCVGPPSAAMTQLALFFSRASARQGKIDTCAVHKRMEPRCSRTTGDNVSEYSAILSPVFGIDQRVVLLRLIIPSLLCARMIH